MRTLPFGELADFLLRLAPALTVAHPQMGFDLAELAKLLNQPNIHKALHFNDPCPDCGGRMVVSYPVTRESEDYCQGYRAVVECSDCGEVEEWR